MYHLTNARKNTSLKLRQHSWTSIDSICPNQIRKATFRENNGISNLYGELLLNDVSCLFRVEQKRRRVEQNVYVYIWESLSILIEVAQQVQYGLLWSDKLLLNIWLRRLVQSVYIDVPRMVLTLFLLLLVMQLIILKDRRPFSNEHNKKIPTNFHILLMVAKHF